MPEFLPAWLILAIVALPIGSFIGVLVVRLPRERPVIADRSRCEHCHHVLGPRDLIPLVSWLSHKGRCRYCGARMGIFYPLVEFAALGIVLWAATVASGWVLIASCVLGWALLALALIDWRDLVLPDPLTLFLLLSGLAAAFAIDPSQLNDRLIGAAAGFALFALLAWGYRAVRKREGMGFGDAKLIGGLGAWVSWQGLATVVLFAAVLGLLVVLGRALMGARLSATDRLPFGTFLALAGWLVWLYGPLIAAPS